MSLIVRLVHYCLIGMLVVVPFVVSDPTYLSWYLACNALVMCQWVWNNNRCCMTQLEHWVGGAATDDEAGNFVWFLGDGMMWLVMMALFMCGAYKWSKMIPVN